jgi:hypothetical protein
MAELGHGGKPEQNGTGPYLLNCFVPRRRDATPLRGTETDAPAAVVGDSSAPTPFCYSCLTDKKAFDPES